MGWLVRAWRRGAAAELVVLGERAGIGVFQVVGSFGAADNQPERRPIDALAIALVLAGPVALAWRDRWPLVAVAVAWPRPTSTSGSATRTGRSSSAWWSPSSPPSRPGGAAPTWVLAAAGYVGFVVASSSTPGPTASRAASTWPSSPAGWSWCWPCRRWCGSAGSRRPSGSGPRHEERQRRVGEQRLRAGPGAARRAGPQHLAHQRAGQRRPPPDRRAARAGPARARHHQGGQPRRPPRAAGRARRAAPGRGRAPRARAPRWPTSTPWSTASAPAASTCASSTTTRPAAAAGRRRAGRLPHRAGGAHQRHPPRPGPRGHRPRRRTATGVTDRGDRRRRGTGGLGGAVGPATASSACGSGRRRSAARSTAGPGPGGGFRVAAAYRAARPCDAVISGRHRRRPGPGAGRVPGPARRPGRHHRGRRGGRRRRGGAPRPRAAARRRADGHPHAGRRRAGRHPPHRRGRRGWPTSRSSS